MKSVRILIVFLFLCGSLVTVQAQQGTCVTRADRPLNAVNPFPNEMQGLNFYGKGKLSGVALGVSTKDDVRKILGTPLKTSRTSDYYDYDSDWLVIFNYISEIREIRPVLENGVKVTKNYVTSPEYIGKLNTILLRPKKGVRFNAAGYPDKTVKPWRSGDKSFDFYDSYSDSYGLTYNVYNRDGKLQNELNDEEYLAFSKGDIMEVRYLYPCVSDPNMFIEEK